MADTNKIFKDLQNHTESPPPGLYAKLWKQVKLLSNPGSDLPAKMLHNTGTTNSAAETKKAFTDLQLYTDTESIPPPFDFQKIKEALTNSRQENIRPQNFITKKWLYRTAAAAAVLAGIVLLYINSSSDLEKIAGSTPEKEHHTGMVKKGAVSVIKDSTNHPNRNHTANRTISKDIVVSNQANKVVQANTGSAYRINMLNDDFVYTLTNFTATEAADLLAGLQKERKLSSNSYTYVNVSGKMHTFLKQLYALNRRNKPTWKARRNRAKLNRWKKADEQYFDKGTGKDPLDILDLSEFILKNKQ